MQCDHIGLLVQLGVQTEQLVVDTAIQMFEQLGAIARYGGCLGQTTALLLQLGPITEGQCILLVAAEDAFVALEMWPIKELIWFYDQNLLDVLQ